MFNMHRKTAVVYSYTVQRTYLAFGQVRMLVEQLEHGVVVALGGRNHPITLRLVQLQTHRYELCACT